MLHKSAGGVDTDYIYAGSLQIAKKQGSNIHYLHTDLLGSPIDGKVGSTSYTENYSPWGEKLSNPIQLAGDVGYTGHQSDVATGLTYMQARYYDPLVGRFMAVDTLSFDGARAELFGRYDYAKNNPYRFIDPDGRDIQISLYEGSHGNPFDHIGIGTTNTDGTYGLRPKDGEGIGLNEPVPGVVAKDDGRIIKTLTIETSPEQDAVVESEIEQAVGDDEQVYDLFDNSCVDFVRDTLKEAGVELPESKQRGRRARRNRRGQAELANTPHGFFDGIEELGEVETDD